MTALTSSVLKEVNDIYSLSATELGDKYYELFGERPCLTKLSYVRKEIIFRIQERFYGASISTRKDAMDRKIEQVKQQQEENSTDTRFMPGTHLVRIYNDVTHDVTIRDAKTYEYNGCLYRSLSAIAKKITGTNWNGKRFFGITK